MKLTPEQARQHAKAVAVEYAKALVEAELTSVRKMKSLQVHCPHPLEDDLSGECGICGRKIHAIESIG